MTGQLLYLAVVVVPVGLILWVNLRAIARQRRLRAQRDAWTDQQRRGGGH